jgi:NTP pyrophosphatase (non-canonical NTP hydrolase)
MENTTDTKQPASPPLPAPAGSATWEHVLQFAQRMESKLSKNRHKGDRAGWLNTSPEILMHRLKEELKELEDAFWDGDATATAHECADVANFAMMIADWFTAHAQLPPNVLGQARRGTATGRNSRRKPASPAPKG